MERRGKMLSAIRGEPAGFDRGEGDHSCVRPRHLDTCLGRRGCGKTGGCLGRMSVGHLLPFNYPGADKK